LLQSASVTFDVRLSGETRFLAVCRPTFETWTLYDQAVTLRSRLDDQVTIHVTESDPDTGDGLIVLKVINI